MDFILYGYNIVCDLWILFCMDINCMDINWFTNEDKRGFSRPMRVLRVGKYM